MKRLVAAILAAGWLAAAPMQAAGDADRKKLNVDFEIGWGGCYRPLVWTPLTLSVTSPLKEHVAVEVGLSVAQDELNRLRIRRLAVLEAESTVHIPLMARLAVGAVDCDVSMTGIGKRFFWSRTYELRSRDAPSGLLTGVPDRDMLIGVTGRQGFGLMDLGRDSSCNTGRPGGRVHVKYKFARLLPADWPGYAALDALVLYDADWERLNPHQSRAVARWVGNGGRVLFVLGANALAPGHPLAALLPFAVGAAREVTLPAATLRRWGWRQPEPGGQRRTACWSFDAAAGAPGWRVDRQGDSVIAAWGPSGFGAVGVVGFDPAAAAGGETDHVAAAQFWVGRLAPLLDGRRVISTGANSGSDSDWYGYQPSPADAASNEVLEHLLSIAELRPMHAGWIVGVLAALALLIGPVDYLVLKKLGRLPLTWLTASLWIALFSVGAYYGVQYIRAGVLKARVVSVVDGVADGNGPAAGWATCHAGIYSPGSDDYRPVPPGGGELDRGQWWSGAAHVQSRGMYYGQSGIGSRNIYCLQHADGGNLPVSVPINIWSMQCLLAETPVRDVPLRATVTRRGRDDWEIAITNRSPALLKSGYAMVGGGRAIWLGAVRPGQSRTFRGRGERPGPWQWSDGVRGNALAARGTWARTEGIRRLVDGGGAAAVCAEFEQASPLFALAGRNCRFEHVQLVRLVVKVR